MEVKVFYGSYKGINIDEVPELLIIKDHITEYYPDDTIYVFPYVNSDKEIHASFYIGSRCVASTVVSGNAWVHKIRHRKELENKLTLIGVNVR